MKANDLKPGQVLQLDGQLLLVTKTEHVKPGKGGAFVQAKLKSIKHGNVTEKRFRSVDEVESTNLDRRDIEFLYAEGKDGVFMDCETYDQFTIMEDVLGDSLLFCKANEVIKGLFYEGQPLTLELPLSVEHEIAETEPGIKNATATNVMKEAVTETGLKVRIPPFINAGEKVKINTETREYLGRVND
ncbi:MAG: elongation factor P [Planctomycetota bacterium]